MNKSKIEWCTFTWNPVSGCLHGCKYCYARKIANRFGGKYLPYGDEINILDRPLDGEKGVDPFPYKFEPTFHRYRLDEPQKVKKPSTIFVCSMADLFGEWVPDEWIEQVFAACEKAPQHRYMFLTKNPKRYSYLYCFIDSAQDNFWLGTTAVDEDSFINKGADLYQNTGNGLKRGERSNRFMSIEPLLGPIHESTLYPCIRHLDLVIIGAETGNRKGKIIPERRWIEDIVKQCKDAKVPVFMKDNLKTIWGEELIRERIGI